MEPVLDDLIAGGLVSYQYVTNASGDFRLKTPTEGRSYNWQVPIFTLCLERYGERHRWMGFIDADEFVVPTGPAADAGDDGSSWEDSSSGDGDADDGDGTSNGGDGGGEDGGSGPAGALPALLRQYEQHGGLVLYWQLFAFDGHIERPGGGVLASYTSCWPQNNGIHRHVKSFVQVGHALLPCCCGGGGGCGLVLRPLRPFCAARSIGVLRCHVFLHNFASNCMPRLQPAYTIKPHTAHSFIYRDGQGAVNTLGARVSGPIIRKGKVRERQAPEQRGRAACLLLPAPTTSARGRLHALAATPSATGAAAAGPAPRAAAPLHGCLAPLPSRRRPLPRPPRPLRRSATRAPCCTTTYPNRWRTLR